MILVITHYRQSGFFLFVTDLIIIAQESNTQQHEKTEQKNDGLILLHGAKVNPSSLKDDFLTNIYKNIDDYIFHIDILGFGVTPLRLSFYLLHK